MEALPILEWLRLAMDRNCEWQEIETYTCNVINQIQGIGRFWRNLTTVQSILRITRTRDNIVWKNILRKANKSANWIATKQDWGCILTIGSPENTKLFLVFDEKNQCMKRKTIYLPYLSTSLYILI